MWILLASTTALPIMADVGSPATAEDLRQLKVDIRASQDMLAEIGDALATITQMGKKDTPEYQDVLASYQELSRSITKASKLVQEQGAQQDAVQRTEALAADNFDLSGVNSIKGTLGPTGTASLSPAVAGQISSGPEVANLQKFLNAVGFPAPISGPYETRTRLAVQQFQAKYGLKATGAVGAETRKFINDMIVRFCAEASEARR